MLTQGDLVALVRRPPKGLLGGMLALPVSAWRAEPFAEAEVLASGPVAANWHTVGEVEHVFTHFSLTQTVVLAEGEAEGLIWYERSALEGLPSVFLKAARLALSSPGGRRRS